MELYEIISGIGVKEEVFKELIRQIAEFKLLFRQASIRTGIKVDKIDDIELCNLKWVQSGELPLRFAREFADNKDFKENCDNMVVPYLVGYIESNIYGRNRRMEVCRLELKDLETIGVIPYE